MDLVTNEQFRSVKAFGSILLVSCALAFSGVVAQETEEESANNGSNDETVELVESAFQTADHEALIDLAHRRVEISILGQGSRYSHSQAEMVLRDFFRRNPPERVELSEQLAADDNRAASGRYWVESRDSPFSLHVGFRVVDGDQWQLASIRIDRPSFRRSANG